MMRRLIERYIAVLAMTILLFSTVALSTVQAAPATVGLVDCGQVHTVQRGENLFRIALRYGTTYQALQQLNGLSDSNRLYAGQQLCVQASAPTPVERTEVRNIVALSTVRIRIGPGTHYPIVGRLFAGKGASVNGISPDHKWWRIGCGTAGNGNCWVSADPNLTRPTGFTDPGNKPAPGPIQETGEAVVENVTVQILESYPPQVVAVLRGYLPDPCVSISEVRQVRESTTFRIRITTQRRSDARCQTVIEPFEKSVPLDVAGLPAGTYNVRVNNLVAPFTLDKGEDPDSGDLLPVRQTPVRYVQAQANLRIRSGPGTHYSIIGGVADGQTALVTGISMDGRWWRVICPDDRVGNCFVSADPSLTKVTGGV